MRNDATLQTTNVNHASNLNTLPYCVGNDDANCRATSSNLLPLVHELLLLHSAHGVPHAKHSILLFGVSCYEHIERHIEAFLPHAQAFPDKLESTSSIECRRDPTFVLHTSRDLQLGTQSLSPHAMYAPAYAVRPYSRSILA